MTRSNDCSATSKMPIPRKTFRLCALSSLPRCYPISQSSWQPTQFGDLVNRVTDVKLMQGDLAEAWREGRSDYATVAMRFALKGFMVERASGRIVEGGERSEVTELWT